MDFLVARKWSQNVSDSRPVDMVMREFNDFIFGMEWMCTLTRSVFFL